ncbi:MAG: undecaprenyl-diphosphate phosphatase [Cellvibrionaceae bacterium]
MELLHIIVLALVQGLTEFLPISSSGHLILPKELLNWPDQGLAFDVAVHVGSLVAVLVYFRHDVSRLLKAWFLSFYTREQTADSRLGWYVIVGTIPVCVVGLLFDDFIETNLRSMAVIATTTVLFGILLGVADKIGRFQYSLEDFNLKTALLVGASQILALIPGTSRSGITITAGLLLGFDRQSAARFSFLLSIPVILLSGGYKGLQLLLQDTPVPWGDIGMGAIVSGFSAYLCIDLFLRFINKVGMMPFVIYRLLLGAFLFWLVLS